MSSNHISLEEERPRTPPEIVSVKVAFKQLATKQSAFHQYNHLGFTILVPFSIISLTGSSISPLI